MPTFRIQSHGRLQEWIAHEKGYFTDEGLDYEFVHNPLMSDQVATPSTNSVPDHQEGAFEKMEEGLACEVGSACHWAVNMAASATHSRMWGSAYSMTPSGVYVAPDSQIRRPRDLANVSIGVGYHSGSHFSLLQSLEQVLAEDEVHVSYVGGPQDRLALLLDGKIEAANLFGPPMYVVEQQGFRKVLDTTFMIGFLIDERSEREDVERYFRALRRAQRDLDAEPSRYKEYYLREVAEHYHPMIDVQAFGNGERIVFEPYTREVYEGTYHWIEERNLFPAGQKGRLDYNTAILV